MLKSCFFRPKCVFSAETSPAFRIFKISSSLRSNETNKLVWNGCEVNVDQNRWLWMSCLAFQAISKVETISTARHWSDSPHFTLSISVQNCQFLEMSDHPLLSRYLSFHASSKMSGQFLKCIWGFLDLSFRTGSIISLAAFVEEGLTFLTCKHGIAPIVSTSCCPYRPKNANSPWVLRLSNVLSLFGVPYPLENVFAMIQIPLAISCSLIWDDVHDFPFLVSWSLISSSLHHHCDSFCSLSGDWWKQELYKAEQVEDVQPIPLIPLEHGLFAFCKALVIRW
jgi:hypothetical protein